MLAKQRARAILQQLSQHRTVSVTDLCKVTGASEATILPLGEAQIITDRLPDRRYLDCTEVIAV